MRLRLLIIAVLIAPPLAAAYVTPDFGLAYTMAPLAQPGRVGVTVAVTPEKDVRFEDLSTSVSAVAFGGVYDSELLPEFKAIAETPKGATPQINVTAEGPKLRPGLYTVTLAIASKASPLPQRVTLQLTIPVGELKALSAQTIDRLLYCLWRCPDRSVPVLHVTETSNRTRLTNVQAKQNEQLVAPDNAHPNASIRSTAPISLEAGGVGDVPLTIDNEGALPLGKSTTIVAVTGNGLAAPVYVPFEVRVRLDAWLLLPAILLGLAFGIGLRVLLKRFIDRGTAQAGAYEVIETIKAAERSARDRLFLEAIGRARSTLAESFDGDAAAVTAAIAAATTAFQTAKNDLQTRLDSLAAAIRAEHEVTRSANFPDAIGAALATAEQALAEVEALYAARNAADGTDALQRLKRKLADDVAAAAADWRTQVRSAIAELRQLPLPTPVGTTLLAAVAGLETKLASILADAKNAEAILDQVHGALFDLEHEVGRGALEPLADYADRVAELIQQIPAQAEGVRQAAAALRKAVDDDRAHALEGPVAAARAMLDAMRKVTLAATPPERRNAVKALLEAGKYAEAATAAAAGEEVGLESGGQHAVPALAAAAMAGGDWRATAAASSAPTADAVFGTIAPSAWLRWELALAKALSSVAIAVLLSLAGFAFLYPGFDGTLRGLLTAFFWGYASDFSAEAITQAARQR